MRFCPVCENLLLPHKGKLYCKACGYEVSINDEDRDEYLDKIRMNKANSDEEPIINKEPNNIKITVDQRKAFEEYFVY